jgi:hypothetical protein
MNEDYAGLNLVELLDLLEPIPEPEPVSMLPETQGWLWLGLLLLVLAVRVGRNVYRRWRSNAYRRAALRAIASANNNPQKIAEILRRTALAAYPRDQVAGLTGEQWLTFLDRTGTAGSFTKEPGRVLAVLPYKPYATSESLAPLAVHWIKSHKKSGEHSG